MLLYTLVQVWDDEQEMFLGVFDTQLKAVRAARRYMGNNKDLEFAIHVVELNDKDITPVVPNVYVTAKTVESRVHKYW